jgi:hypothetical protein
LLGGFAAVERMVAAPLVDLRLLAPGRWSPGLRMLAASGLLISGFFVNSLLLQRVMGLSALGTGLVFRPVAAAGFALAAIGMALLGGISAGDDAVTGVLPGFVLAAAGLGMAFVTATTTALSRIDPRRAGLVSGVVTTAHELGAALGVVIASTLAGTSVDGGSAAT